MEGRLEIALKAIIDLLQVKRAQLEGEESKEQATEAPPKANSEQLIRHLDETKELLKLSSGIHKIKN